MSADNLTIRRMTRAEVDLAIDWAAGEGWNPGLQDAHCFHAADPNGFFIAYLDSEPVGCISVVAYDDSFGFLGLYIVRPQFRGKGYGQQIWKTGIAYLGDRNIGLDGVVAQQTNYKKSGFCLAHRNIRYECNGRTARPSGVTALSEIPFDVLSAYDSALFPVARARFLREWIAQPGAVGYAVLDAGRLAGYGMLRPCRRGYKVGPLFADDAGIADRLLNALRAHAQDEPSYLDLPESNPAALMLAERHNMRKVFETARMYTKEAPALPIERVFGITTFELG
jgi:GNAT superfamily N-acetyltransferase